MAKPFTKENARQMALRSAEARKRNREQMKRLEGEVTAELGDKPFTRLILAKLRKHPEVANEIIDAMFAKAAAGNVRAFNAIVDRTDGRVRSEPEPPERPVIIRVVDWGRLREDHPAAKPALADGVNVTTP